MSWFTRIFKRKRIKYLEYQVLSLGIEIEAEGKLLDRGDIKEEFRLSTEATLRDMMKTHAEFLKELNEIKR